MSFAYLQRCRLCGYSWPANPLAEVVLGCANCGVEFAGRERTLVSCDTFHYVVTEPWLFRFIYPKLQVARSVNELVDTMTEVTSQLGLEPQVDLTVHTIDVTPGEARRLWHRMPDGTFRIASQCGPMPEARSMFAASEMVETLSTIVFEDEGHNRYATCCTAALLRGWRAPLGDA